MKISLLAAGVPAVLALAALAGAAPEPVPPADSSAAQPLPADELDLKRLSRERRDALISDLFTNPAPPAPAAPPPAPAVAEKPEPPPAPSAPPLAPSAPPLPFSYLGKMTKGERTIIYLLKNQELVLAEAGHTLDNDYRVEDVSDSAVQFVYLPLNTRQVLNVPPRQ